uniref:Uncharacterized protein n=1 Tax=Anopheles dirus TaxID=7168 RepID=A0A182NXI2_9DIPT
MGAAAFIITIVVEEEKEETKRDLTKGKIVHGDV